MDIRDGGGRFTFAFPACCVNGELVGLLIHLDSFVILMGLVILGRQMSIPNHQTELVLWAMMDEMSIGRRVSQAVCVVQSCLQQLCSCGGEGKLRYRKDASICTGVVRFSET